GDVKVRLELTRAGLTSPFRDVEGDAVGGPAPLRAECEHLERGEGQDRISRQEREAPRFLPRDELPEVAHARNLSDGRWSASSFRFAQGRFAAGQPGNAFIGNASRGNAVSGTVSKYSCLPAA